MGHERLSQYTRDEKFKKTENMMKVHNNMKISKENHKTSPAQSFIVNDLDFYKKKKSIFKSPFIFVSGIGLV